MKFTTRMPWVGRDRRARREVEVDITDNPSIHPDQTRRAFIRTGLLAGLAGLGWLLLRRSCAGSGACNSCRQFAGCGLPWKINQQ